MFLVLPTKRGAVMVCSSVCALAVALVNVNLTTSVVAACLCGITVSSLLLALFSLYNVGLERGPSGDGFKAAKLSLPLVVTNRSRRSRQALIARETCPFTGEKRLNAIIDPLAPGERRLVDRLVWANRRGHFELSKVALIGGDPAGLFYRKKTYKLPTELMIYPEMVKLPGLPLSIRGRAQSFTAGEPLGVSGIGQEFFGVREYRPCDGVRFIHWKATAKQRKLMIREFEANSVTQVDVILDVDRRYACGDPINGNFEYLVTVASTIVQHLAGMYCHTLFITGYGMGITKIRGDAIAIRNQVIKTLALATPMDVTLGDLIETELGYFQPNSILYCLTMSNPDSFREHAELLLERGVDVRWIYAPKANFPRGGAAQGQEGPETEVAEKDMAAPDNVLEPFVVRKGMNVAKVLTYG